MVLASVPLPERASGHFTALKRKRGSRPRAVSMQKISFPSPFPKNGFSFPKNRFSFPCFSPHVLASGPLPERASGHFTGRGTLETVSRKPVGRFLNELLVSYFLSLRSGNESQKTTFISIKSDAVNFHYSYAKSEFRLPYGQPHARPRDPIHSKRNSGLRNFSRH
jgi:hypothetical protein